MKNRGFFLPFTLYLLPLLLLFGCRSAKKISSEVLVSQQATSGSSENISQTGYHFLDTTKKVNNKTTYFHIEFYPPEEQVKDEELKIEAEENQWPDLPLTRYPAPVKSITALTVETLAEQAGIVSDSTSTTYNAALDRQEETVVSEVSSEQPAPDPYRWRYFFGIIIVIGIAGVGIYIAARKWKIFSWIVTVFKKIF
jgi:hypothetical protein